MTPAALMRHLGGLMAYAAWSVGGLEQAELESWRGGDPREWATEVSEFDRAVRALDAGLREGHLPGEVGGDEAPSWQVWLQGPVIDALTHIGQLAMLRRLAGAPVNAIGYRRAAIIAGAFIRLQTD